jgi:hypothetical protein
MHDVDVHAPDPTCEDTLLLRVLRALLEERNNHWMLMAGIFIVLGSSRGAAVFESRRDRLLRNLSLLAVELRGWSA